MFSRLTQFIRNLLFSWMNKEFLIFLFFLLLSGVFWLMMAMNDTYEREVKIPVYLDKIPKKVVVTSNTEDTLRVTLRDRGFSLAPYIYGGVMPMAINFSTYDRGDGKGTVTSSELQKLINQNIFKSTKIVSLKPDRFDFTYNYGESKKVGLRLQGTVIPSQSYYIAKGKFNPAQVTVYSAPPITAGTLTARSPGRVQGTSFGSKDAGPMSTATEDTLPKRVYRCSAFTPLAVSMVMSGLRTMPLSYRYLAAQRMALPPMAPSVPSRLYWRIRASAMSLRSTRAMPSAPTP